MSSVLGKAVTVSIFGQSHGEAVGMVMDGVPAGEAIDLDALQAFLSRRAPGGRALVSARQEKDVPRFLSGLVDGKTCGAPISAVIENQNARPGDYDADLPRPGHADYPAHVRYGGHTDLHGGGHFSGRLTAPLCVAGGIALQILARRDIHVGAWIASVGSIERNPIDTTHIDAQTIETLRDQAIPDCMRSEIEAAMTAGDSIGGVIACRAVGVPAGLGSPMFGGVENRLSAAVFGIPAVRGIEFGAGFAAAGMRGSQHNDAYRLSGNSMVTETNNHGGILGGITTGMPLVFQVAFKPTPSIAQPQRTVRLSTMAEETLQIRGRHDPCIVMRAAPCVEAAAALVLLDLLVERNGTHGA